MQKVKTASQIDVKKLKFTSLLGKVAITENVLRQGSGTVRSLASLLSLKPCGCTINLQWAVVDFDAEEFFARASERLGQHHRVKLSESTVRKITLQHANKEEGQ